MGALLTLKLNFTDPRAARGPPGSSLWALTNARADRWAQRTRARAGARGRAMHAGASTMFS